MELPHKLALLHRLAERVGVSLEALLDRYPDPAYYRRLLGLSPGWSPEDEENLAERLYGTRHHRNARSPRTYASDLLLGWLLQDIVLALFHRVGIPAQPAGADRDRVLRKGPEVSEEPDLFIPPDWWVDIMADYPTRRGKPSYWKDSRRLHLRDNKFRRLVERAQRGRAGVLGVVVQEGEYFWLEITPALARELEAPPPRGRRLRRLETHWPYGGKPAVELRLDRLGVAFRPLEDFPAGLPFRGDA